MVDDMFPQSQSAVNKRKLCQDFNTNISNNSAILRKIKLVRKSKDRC